ncbi:MAG: agmatinase [bacterium]
MKGPAPRALFLGARRSFEESRAVLFGCPFDETASRRKGARSGPGALRAASDAIETYSPLLDADLEDLPFCDVGDLALPEGDVAGALERIGAEARRILSAGKIPFGLGGDHLVSLPLIEAAAEAHPGLLVLQWDAHADLRDAYEGAALSHATVMRRAGERVGPGRVLPFGVRSGTREEWTRLRGEARLRGEDGPRPLTPAAVEEALGESAGAPLYLTLDLDVLDPGEFPGTGTPEPGGVSFAALSACIAALGRAGAPIVALDAVELSPPCDPGGVSAVAAAKAVRELLLVLPA